MRFFGMSGHYLAVSVLLFSARPAMAQLALHSCSIEGQPIRCGTMRVAENPSAFQGRQLTLGLLVAPRAANESAKEAVFVLTGGPGAAATTDAESFLEMLRPLRASYDLVLLNQRGTAGGNKLHCDVADGRFTVPRDPIACVAQLSKQADLRFYTTEFFVRDIEAARAALGYERISLWGASYGTRAAFVYAKRYPARVRSLVLVAPVPMSMSILDSFDEDGRAAMDALVADCLSDTRCAQAFPQLRTDVDTARGHLADPFHVLGVQLLQYSSDTARALPLLLSRAARGSTHELDSAIQQFRAQLLSKLSIGLHLAVICYEDYPFDAPGRSATAKRSVLRDEYAVACRAWPRAAVPRDFRASVSLNVPALVISGEWDPVTPPRWARAAARQFASSQIVILPKTGHMPGPHAPCLGTMSAAFLSFGAADTSCVSRVSRPPYAMSTGR